MTYDWQEQWENAGLQEYRRFYALGEKQLMAQLKNKDWGSNYMLWDAIADRKSKKMIKPLFEAMKYLKGVDLFLDRHHCTEAIFKLANIREEALKERIIGPSTGFDEKAFKEALKELKILLGNKIT